MPIKKDPYATPAQKLLGLYGLLLFSGRKHSLPQLADAFRCSRQTILRMMEQIELTHGLDIKSWMEDGRRWYQANTPDRKPNITLDVEAIQQLLLCRDFVWHILPEFLRKNISQTITQTTVLLPNFEDREEALTHFAMPHAKGAVDYDKHQRVIHAILKTMRGKIICEIEYKSHDSKTAKTLTVAPLQIVAFHDSLYVKCRLEKALPDPTGFYDPMLAIQRITGVKPTRRHFNLPTSTQIESPDTFGFMPGHPFRVKVAISPRAAAFVRERQWSKDQVITEQRDGGIILEFTATSQQEVISWVLGFAEDTELLEPEKLRGMLKRCMEGILNRY